MFPILTALVVLPLVGAAVVWLLPEGLRDRSRQIALVFAAAELVAVLATALRFDRGAAGDQQFAEVHSWIPQIGASWALGVNGLALMMVILAALLTPLVILAGWNDDEDPRRRSNYLALVLVLSSFMVAIFMARDVFLFYVLFEAMLVPLMLMIGVFGGEQRRYAAVKFLLFSLVGGLVMLVAVIALFVAGPGGEQGFLIDNLTGLDLPVIAERLMFLGFFFAFAIKAPMFPVHTWLPTVAQTARPGTTTLLVAVLDKVGTYGMLTLCIVLFPNAAAWAAPVIIVFAVISVIYGALLAIGQQDMMRLVAFISVSHFGVMVLGIFAFQPTSIEGASFYMFNHGLSTGALFLLVGFLVQRHGTANVDAFGGLQRVVPVFAGLFLVVGLSALALPGLSPFVSEIMVLVGSYPVAGAAAIIAALAVILAALYILLTYQRVFTGEPTEVMKVTPELSWRERAVVAPLIALMLVLGIAPALGIDVLRDGAAQTAQIIELAEAAQ